MANTTETKKRSVDVPWATIIAIVAATGGFFLYLNPLQTSRPSERGGLHSDVDRSQNADARLWQDPLRAASEHDAFVQWRYNDSREELDREAALHSPDILFKEHEAKTSQVLAVMIPGNAYAEYAEARLRMRQAVIEGLGATDYVPDDGEHIGYIKVSMAELGWHNMIIPFEWCHRDSISKGAPNKGSAANLCVLWLRDEEFRDKNPLFHFDSLIRKTFQIDTSIINTSIIGPYSSTTLKEMVKEAVAPATPQHLLQNVNMWCATATAADELLLAGVVGAEDFREVEDLFAKKQTESFHFRRSTLTDSEVIEALINELQARRYAHLSPKSNCKAGPDRIAVISEFDTFFGRALPISVREAVLRTRNVNDVLNSMCAENVLTFRYLRGIDGMLPGADPAEIKSKATDQSKSAVARESTEGLNQSDYLRRLAAQLVKQDRDFRQQGGNGIKAIGVLGSDIYDKLMVLEALRRALPDAVFFTNNLDARLAHPNEWRWTRNLLVASPFGLTLKSDLQKVPPFRDSNQTAMYAATLLATDDDLAKKFTRASLNPVRLYEIGRRGAFDLTQGVKGDSLLQPQSLDLKPWWNWWRFGWAVAILLMIVGAAVWILRAIIGPPSKALRSEQTSLHEADTRKPIWRSAWVMFLFFALLSAVIIWLISFGQRTQGDPYSWVDGISVWPTETFRLLVVFLSWFYILRTSRVVLKNEVELEKRFALSHTHNKPEPKSWKEFSTEIFNTMSPRKWKYETNDGQVSADKLWACYADSGQERVRWARIVPLIILYTLAGFFLMFLLGWPAMPARGSWARG